VEINRTGVKGVRVKEQELKGWCFTVKMVGGGGSQVSYVRTSRTLLL
jgi:hypothetical protein